MRFDLKFDRQLIFLLFILIPIFKPAGLAYYTSLNTLFKLWKMVSLLCMSMFVIYSVKSIQMTSYIKGIAALALFWFIYIFNCMRFNASYGDVLNNALTSIILLLFIRYEFSQGEGKTFLNGLEIIFTVWIVLQSLSLFYIRAGHTLFEPLEDGFTYFLGMDNYSAFATLLMIGVLLFNDIVKYGENQFSKKNLFLLGLLMAGYLYVRSVTAIVSFLFLIMMMLLKKYWDTILQFISIKKAMFLIAILLILILTINIQNLVAGFLASGLLGKGSYGITLNSRTIIWAQAVDMIFKRPLLGNGELTVDQIAAHALYGASHAHNIFIELLFRTGVCGFIAYMCFIFGSLGNSWKNIMKSKASILLVTLISYILLSFMDFYPTMQYIYCFVGILYCSNCFEEECQCSL